MERHPSEYFIKYLMTLPRAEAKNNDWICMGVQAIGYPIPDVEYLDRLRHDLYQDVPGDYRPADRYHRATTKFLRKHQVWSFHHPDDTVQEAWDILRNFQVRRLVEQLLLGRLENREVAKKTNSRLGAHYRTAAIACYSHYYWNCSLLKVRDWDTFLKLYDDQEASKAMAILNNGPAMALHVTGFEQNLESKHMLKEMQEALYFDFKDWEKRPRSAEKTRALTNIAKAATQLDIRLSEADTALKNSLQAFEQFRMRHAQSEVKSIEDLAGKAAFSNSGVTMKELPPGPDKNPNEAKEPQPAKPEK